MSLPPRLRRLSLDVKLISAYLVILGIGGLAISVVGSWIVSKTIWHEAQRTVDHDLAIARAWLDQRTELVARAVEAGAAALDPTAGAAAQADRLERLRRGAGLDFLLLTDGAGALLAAAGEAGDDAPLAGALAGGTASGIERLGDGLGLIAATPAPASGGALAGGVRLERHFDLVDELWRRLYGSDGGRGALTLFRDDVRIATTVRDPAGRRAAGTRASEAVRAAVLERGGTWHDRARVVGQWYVTAYEPLRDRRGEIVGMLSVGLPERTYTATRNRVISSFFAIATLGFALVIAVTYRITQGLTRPIRELVDATRSVAAGRFDHPLDVAPESEIGLLARSFDRMQSSLREMRDDLEESARTLEDKVRARSDELAKMQVRMAQSERLASIGLLAAGVAHEINNPLGGILALTSLTLEELPGDDPRRENLEEVVRQTLRCSEIVKHLLEFSRQHQLRAEPVDLNRLLERTVALLERQSIFLNVQIERDLAPDLPPVVADWSQLQQVFMNVLMNAVQAMHERGTITLESRHDRERGEVVLAFRDTGCGIPPEQIDRIFDPFFTTKGDGQGTGLGLSIAYGIVHRHGGTIAAESEPGRGTTFTIRLPAGAAPGTAATVEA